MSPCVGMHFMTFLCVGIRCAHVGFLRGMTNNQATAGEGACRFVSNVVRLINGLRSNACEGSKLRELL